MKLFIAIFILLYSTLYANIDSQIEAIQNASPQERFELMNAFKKKILLLKAKERREALTKLFKGSSKKPVQKVLDEIHTQKQIQQTQKQLEQAAMIQDTIATETEDSNGGDDDDD